MLSGFIENSAYYFEIVLRMALSVLLGGLIGHERESKQRPAGFRTHILVCAGAAIVMLLGEYITDAYPGSDPARLGAQVISGIGFLGAGTIIRHGATIRGLTTAASLWATACIGLAVGAGSYPIAIVGTVFIYLTLLVLHKVEHYIERKRMRYELVLNVTDRPGLIVDITAALEPMGAQICKLGMDYEEQTAHDGHIYMRLTVHIPKLTKLNEVLLAVNAVEGVHTVNKL